MPDRLNIAADAYVGMWTNWSQGKVWGLTWTMGPTSAVVLTNSLAIFVTIASVQLWTIIRYALHHRGTPAAPHIATPHLSKEQVVLRNASSPFETAQALLDLAWTSRRSNGKRSLRAWVIGLAAILYAALFALASVFSNNAISSNKINGGSAILFRSPNCGIWNGTYENIVTRTNVTDLESLSMVMEWKAKNVDDIRLSTQYAQECYRTQASNANMSSTCRTLKQPRLNWTRSDGLCPFHSSICFNDTNAIIFDTGDIDSHDDLGINAKPEERLKYRSIVKCTPLNGTGRIKGWNGLNGNFSNLDPSVRQDAYAYYGRSLSRKTNYTFAYSNFANFYNNYSSLDANPYSLDVERAWAPVNPPSNSSDFEPITELAQTEADLSLHFLSFSGMYLGKIDDAWFSAHEEHYFPSPLSFLNTRYARDMAISTLGCTQQHSFCTEKVCTGLGGLLQVQTNDTFNRALTAHQNVTFDRMLHAIGYSTLARMADFLYQTPAISLLATNLVVGGKQGGWISQVLPSDQWKSEVTFWYATSMANIQRSIALWATGDISPNPKYLIRPVQEQDSWFCTRFMAPSSNHQSFRVVPIIIIAFCGLFVIIAGSVIEDLAGVIRRCFGRSDQRNQWDGDHMLLIPRFITQHEDRPAPPPKDQKYGSLLYLPQGYWSSSHTPAPPAYKEPCIPTEVRTASKLPYCVATPASDQQIGFEATSGDKSRYNATITVARPPAGAGLRWFMPEHGGAGPDRWNWI